LWWVEDVKNLPTLLPRMRCDINSKPRCPITFMRRTRKVKSKKANRFTGNSVTNGNTINDSSTASKGWKQ